MNLLQTGTSVSAHTHAHTRAHAPAAQKDLGANMAIPRPQLPGPRWGSDLPLDGTGPTPDVPDLQSRHSAPTWDQPSREEEVQAVGPGCSRNPTASPEACPLPQDPKGCQDEAWPRLPLPLLAAPLKGAATNSLRHSEAGIWAGGPGKGRGRESQRARSLSEAELSCTRGGYKEGLELLVQRGCPSSQPTPAHLLGSPAPPSKQEALHTQVGSPSPGSSSPALPSPLPSG